MWKYYIFSLSLFCGGILFSPPSLALVLPPAYSLSSGINDKKEWIQRVVGVHDGKWTTPIKGIRLISGCRIAAYRCEQVECRPTRFSLSSHVPPTPCFTPSPHPRGEEKGGGGLFLQER